MNKVIYEIRLTEQEEKLLLQSINSLPSLAWTIIKEAYKRGDFKKKWSSARFVITNYMEKKKRKDIVNFVDIQMIQIIKMKKKKNKITKHHIVPTSRKGKNLESNLCNVPGRQHEIYHNLFTNRTPDEIIDYLVQDFWNGQRKWVDIYQEKYRWK